jgi:hypothetical protein
MPCSLATDPNEPFTPHIWSRKMTSENASTSKRPGPLHVWSIFASVPLCLGLLAWAQQTDTSAQREARIDRLIQQLDDDKFDVREKAGAELATIKSSRSTHEQLRRERP